MRWFLAVALFLAVSTVSAQNASGQGSPYRPFPAKRPAKPTAIGGTLAPGASRRASMAIQATAAPDPRITTFDAPNAGSGANQGTEALSVNVTGAITGDFTDSGNGTHGYVRTPRGEFAEFDAPDADPVVGCTCPQAINDFGVVTGFSIDTNSVAHGFVRSASGNITIFDVPGAGTQSIPEVVGTSPNSANNLGTITGDYIDDNNVSHGFLRAADGNIVTFDVSDAGTGPFQGTFPENVNDFGAVAGFYVDVNYAGHGFLRAPDGEITTFDAPGDAVGTFGALIADLSTIAGYEIDQNFVSHGYVRTARGEFTEFEAPVAGTGISQSGFTEGTFVTAVNLRAATTGFAVDDNAELHAFIRTTNGKAITFDIPGQLAVPGTDLGSAGFGINVAGVVVGRWHDANYVVHGFIREP